MATQANGLVSEGLSLKISGKGPEDGQHHRQSYEYDDAMLTPIESVRHLASPASLELPGPGRAIWAVSEPHREIDDTPGTFLSRARHTLGYELECVAPATKGTRRAHPSLTAKPIKEITMADVLTDHDAIRNWAEQHGGKPAAVDRTHQRDDVGIIRIMFPNAPNSEHSHLVEISWEEFFKEFEERRLALLYDPDSMFNKIIGRDTAERREEGDSDAARHQAASPSSGNGSPDDRHSLKEREYRDERGDIHHHTNPYMDQHAKG